MKLNFKKFEIFWGGFGLCALFFQLPLVDMILKDTQSLALGVWDGWTFFLFSLTTFILIPTAVGLLFYGLSFLSKKTAFYALLILFTALAVQQTDFFSYSQKNWSQLKYVFRIILLGSIIFGFLISFKKLSFELLKLLPFLTIFIFSFFTFKTYKLIFSTHSTASHASPQNGENAYPIFFLSFEKLVASYVENENGQIEKEDFPNLHQFLQEADHYPNTFANSMQTVYSLQSLYTGLAWNRAYPFWELFPHIKTFFAQGNQPVLLLDLLNYCNPKTDLCIRTIGKKLENKTSVIMGWYKTYLKTMVPRPILKHLKLNNWSFNSWDDLWKSEEQFFVEENKNVKYDPAHPVETLPYEKIMHQVGRRQFNFFQTTIQKKDGEPTLYLMHNFISDNPGVKASIFTSSKEELEKDLSKARKNLATLDEELGKFFTFLKEFGIYDSSLIVITSDTGYDPAIHDNSSDDTIPYSDQIARVFLAVKRPSQRQGRRIEAPIQQMDVLPTILKAIGFDDKNAKFDGKVIDPERIDSNRKVRIFLGGDYGGSFYVFSPGDSVMRKEKN